jgi:hypothetical protein
LLWDWDLPTGPTWDMQPLRRSMAPSRPPSQGILISERSSAAFRMAPEHESPHRACARGTSIRTSAAPLRTPRHVKLSKDEGSIVSSQTSIIHIEQRGHTASVYTQITIEPPTSGSSMQTNATLFCVSLSTVGQGQKPAKEKYIIHWTDTDTYRGSSCFVVARRRRHLEGCISWSRWPTISRR